MRKREGKNKYRKKENRERKRKTKNNNKKVEETKKKLRMENSDANCFFLHTSVSFLISS